MDCSFLARRSYIQDQLTPNQMHRSSIHICRWWRRYFIQV